MIRVDETSFELSEGLSSALLGLLASSTLSLFLDDLSSVLASFSLELRLGFSSDGINGVELLHQ